MGSVCSKRLERPSTPVFDDLGLLHDVVLASGEDPAQELRLSHVVNLADLLSRGDHTTQFLRRNFKDLLPFFCLLSQSTEGVKTEHPLDIASKFIAELCWAICDQVHECMATANILARLGAGFPARVYDLAWRTVKDELWLMDAFVRMRQAILDRDQVTQRKCIQ
jgi:hypothetical protein